MGSILKFYQKLLKKYPLTTSSVQTGLLMAIGDVTAQTVIEKIPLKQINWVRTTQFASVGLLFAGPVLTTWYSFLAQQFGSGGKAVVLKKVACDQLIFAPCFIAPFLAAVEVTQGKDFHSISEKVKINYTDVLLNNYRIWPWVQLGNFYLVPVQYQILVVQTVAIFWNTYLSWKTRASTESIKN